MFVIFAAAQTGRTLSDFLQLLVVLHDSGIYADAKGLENVED
jgi:hypothetical protein